MLFRTSESVLEAPAEEVDQLNLDLKTRDQPGYLY